jgi:hypothetical protein
MLTERVRIGTRFLRYFPAKMSQKEAGKAMGMSGEMIRMIEGNAAYKIMMRMRASLRTPKGNPE